MRLRTARLQDASAILDIYAPYIENTTITFEYAVPTEAEFQKRIENIMTAYPYYVCEDKGEVIGYAYGCRFSERAAYNWDMELSVYIKDGFKGKGIASALYGALIETGEYMGVRNFYARITAPNLPSENLHRRFGFVLEGTLKKSGFKHSVWKDVLYYTKHIKGDEPPAPLIPFPELSPQTVAKILSEYEKAIK